MDVKRARERFHVGAHVRFVAPLVERWREHARSDAQARRWLHAVESGSPAIAVDVVAYRDSEESPIVCVAIPFVGGAAIGWFEVDLLVAKEPA